MNELSLWGVKDIVKPTAAKLGIDENLMRIDGYTTNGYWMIKSEFEPKFMRSIRENDKKPGLNIIFDRAKRANIEVEVINELRFEGNLMIKVGNKDFFSWVNVAFLSMFANLNKKLTFYQEDPRGQIVVKDGEQFIGVIMPINIY